MKKVVLLTGIGGDISQCVATILRTARPDLSLVGVDVQTQHGGHLLVDHFETIPTASNSEYPDAIGRVVEKYDAKVVIPMTEPELASIYKSKIEIPGVVLVTAGSQVVEAGLDKFATVTALKELGLKMPWTVSVTDGDPEEYPCILKSRFGSGSRAVFRVDDAAEADFLKRKHPDAIFQQLLLPDDKEVTCAVYRFKDGRVAVLQMLRRLTGGYTGWARIIKNTEIDDTCRRIAEGLNLRGPMNVQLRVTQDGPRVFEINPRYSSTVLMRHMLGFTDLLWAIDESEGKEIIMPAISSGQIVVRVQGAALAGLHSQTTGEI